MWNGVDQIGWKMSREQPIRSLLSNVHVLPTYASPVGVLELLNGCDLTIHLGSLNADDEFNLPPIVPVEVDRFRGRGIVTCIL